MLALVILALGLAMDAFAVSLVRGATGHRSFARALELGFAFGLAQGLMPLLGWAGAAALGDTFRAIDHWIAFGLLSLLGGRMVWEALSSADEPPVSHSRWLGLVTAAFATSIDAAAAGVTLSLFGLAIPAACAVIGLVTATLCTLGYLVGSRVSGRIGSAAELLGGLVLVALGIKILVEHLSV